MLQSIRRYWYLFTILFTLLGCFLGGWGWITFSPPPATHPTEDDGLPSSLFPTIRGLNAKTRLIIPSLNINAPIETVGITAHGDMATPDKHPWTDVGWYKYGPYPGNTGSSVIAGHLDKPGGSPAVFWHLHKIQIGASVLINDGNGNILHFRVIALKMYQAENAPTKEIFGNEGGRFLNLVTCSGAWMVDQHQTTQRLVVYTIMT